MSGSIIKQLSKPWKVGGVEATDIEVVPATMADLCEAEKEASPMQPHGFAIAMACRQVKRAGTFAGPFAPAHFKTMRAAQFAEIRDALQEADDLGEG